jgi:hypothetical protein
VPVLLQCQRPVCCMAHCASFYLVPAVPGLPGGCKPLPAATAVCLHAAVRACVLHVLRCLAGVVGDLVLHKLAYELHMLACCVAICFGCYVLIAAEHVHLSCLLRSARNSKLSG